MSIESMVSKFISKGSDEPMITVPKLLILVTNMNGGSFGSYSSSLIISSSYSSNS